MHMLKRLAKVVKKWQEREEGCNANFFSFDKINDINDTKQPKALLRQMKVLINENSVRKLSRKSMA